MIVRSFVRLALVLAGMITVCAVSPLSRAQGVASITGVVTDSSGAVVPGANVKIIDTRTGATYFGKTAANGTYEIVDLPPGAGYSLTITKDGFETYIINDLFLPVALTTTRDVQLVLGALNQTVEVTAQPTVTLNTTDASIGNVIDSKQVEDLPSLFRSDATVLLELQPGVQVSGGDSQFGSVTGSRADAGNVTLDGLDVNDETIGSPFAAVGRAPIDSISEVRTIVGGQDATFGRSSGAQVNLVTRSGTNEWHGGLNEFNRVSALAANNFFNVLSGTPRGQLTRNQFGGDLGGPIIKDKFFFFFDYEGRRDRTTASQNIVVPLDNFRSGSLTYINNGPGCTAASSPATQPTCFTILPALGSPGSCTSVQGCDPLGVGADAAFLAFVDSRYPKSNNTFVGDGFNTGGYLFNAPDHLNQNTFVGRLDYALSSKHTLFARGTWDRDNATQVPKAFPQDPGDLFSFIGHERSWVVGDTWVISPTLTNQANFGLTRQVDAFPNDFAPTAPIDFGFGVLSAPYGDIRGQGRNVGVPELRETLSWTKGTHTIQTGVDFKWIRVHDSNTNDISFEDIGLQSAITSLDPTLRPSDISADPSAQNLWDEAFTTILGRYDNTTANYNYDVSGNPLAQFSSISRDFHTNEYELFFQDSWKIRPNLTMTYGLHWDFNSVPFEANGFESVPTVFVNQMLAARVAAGNAGINGPDAAPFVSYTLGGPVNHGPGYFAPDYKDFGPRLGIAYSPSFDHGFLGSLLGNRKTSIRAGGAIAYDRLLNTMQFEIDEASQLFAAQAGFQYGVFGNPEASLGDSGQPDSPFSPACGPNNGDFDCRFTSLTTAPAPVPPGTISRPTFTPGVVGGVPVGLQQFLTLYQLNNNLRSPYSIMTSFGIQRELPGNLILEADYFGRFGRRLVGIGDPGQQINFKDPTSGQFLNTAFGAVQSQLQAGTAPNAVTMQPWFENQINLALAGTGFTCPSVAPFFGISGTINNCTQLAATLFPNNFFIGDVSTVDLDLDLSGLILPNTGLLPQTGSIANVGNFGNSSYNGLVVTLRKRLSNGLQFDFDYQYAHAIDNVSDITNDTIFSSFNGQGLICSLLQRRLCRASSNFDATHTISLNYVYELPFGNGKRFLSGASKALNALVGGWETSGIVSFHTGFPWTAITNAFPIDFTMSAPAVFVGPRSAVTRGIHVENGQLQYFADPAAADGAFGFPFGGGTGERNQLRGPLFSNVDLAILKNFAMPWSDHQTLQFRAEAFNAFNHPSFNNPSVDPSLTGSVNSVNNNIQNPTFGVLTNTANDARQWQFGLMYTF